MSNKSSSISTLTNFSLSEFEDRMFEVDEVLLNSLNVDYFVHYAVILPALAMVGVLGNLITFAAFYRSNFSSLSYLFIDALLISDIFFLICFILSTGPAALIMHRLHRPPPAGPDQGWDLLSIAQLLFIGATPIGDLSRVLKLWFLVGLLFEQFAVVHYPSLTAKMDSIGFGLRTIITVMCFGLLGEMVHFFKYTRRDVFYGYSTVKKKVCHSALYQSQSCQVYDRYVQFALFILLPYTIGVFLIISITSTYLKSVRKRHTARWEINEEEMGQIFEGVRSTKLVVVLGLTGVATFSVSNALYILIIIRFGDYDQFLETGCHVIPMETKFDYVSYGSAVYAYHVVGVVLSSATFVLVYVGFDRFRHGLHRCCHR